MSLFQVNKPKSASKIMLPCGKTLNDQVSATLQHIAMMVGTTLGPGGKPVLIERAEIGLKPIITKDGVTVIKQLGYVSATQQLILETVRDAAMRTASEAGDGTTTATILAESICRGTAEAIAVNPKMSPQKIVRELQALVPTILERLNQYLVKGATVEKQRDLLLKVATVSANGDKDLAQAVLKALDTVGDDGNITLIEHSGPSRYEVERIAGYTVETGYDEACRNFANGFINDRSGTAVILEKPLLILFDGMVHDIYQLLPALNKIGEYFIANSCEHQNVVIMAHGFSDSMIGDLHLNWNKQNTFKVLPMMTKKDGTANGQTELLYDLQAYTGMPVYNPIDRPLVDMNMDFMYKRNQVKMIEMSRFRTSVIATEDSDMIDTRVSELKLRLEKPESMYAANLLQVRIGKLTSGIARLNIFGPSSGETREKRDRAEDAWMSIRGTLKFGALPGGGSSLVKLAADMETCALACNANAKKTAAGILSNALLEPVRILYSNYGYSEREVERRLIELLKSEQTFDIAENAWVSKEDLLDSYPAVAEAIRNAVSIASLLGTLGGIVAFQRDMISDKNEEDFVRRFEQGAGMRNQE